MPRKPTYDKSRFQHMPRKYNVDETDNTGNSNISGDNSSSGFNDADKHSDTIHEVIQESTNFPKGKQSIAIEHMLAELGSYSLRIFTAYLFKPYNAMTEEESKSS